MISIIVQSIPASATRKVPYRLTLLDRIDGSSMVHTFRPECTLPKRLCEQLKVDRMELLNAPVFCELADTLMDTFQDRSLKFLDSRQFVLLKALFRTIGFNFNLLPRYYFTGSKKDRELQDAVELKLSRKQNPYHQEYAIQLLNILDHHQEIKADYDKLAVHRYDNRIKNLITTIKNAAGVYFFYDEYGTVLYVGKAKRLKKRLQSHFSNQLKSSHIDYSMVKDISVEYTGNDWIAQLVESANIKRIQPRFNVQQMDDPAPYIINIGTTAKGVFKASIVRKDYTDNLPEKYFNRSSVKMALEQSCTSNHLCRKHCGLEKIKGPCTRYRVRGLPCVCAGSIELSTYNARFES